MESYADAVRARGEDARSAAPDPHLMLRLADERMYEAKQAGRNCVRYEGAAR
jgi:GGDEF domain-containing protein